MCNQNYKRRKKRFRIFCKILSKNLKAIITNNHTLDQSFLDNEKKLIYCIDKKDIEEK